MRRVRQTKYYPSPLHAELRPTYGAAMADAANVATLMTQGLICEAKVAQAVDAYMRDPSTALFVTFGGHMLDLVEAMRSHPFARQTVMTAWAIEKLKREVVRAAIVMTRPVKS